MLVPAALSAKMISWVASAIWRALGRGLRSVLSALAAEVRQQLASEALLATSPPTHTVLAAAPVLELPAEPAPEPPALPLYVLRWSRLVAPLLRLVHRVCRLRRIWHHLGKHVQDRPAITVPRNHWEAATVPGQPPRYRYLGPILPPPGRQ
jgi:hypothetical protein